MTSDPRDYAFKEGLLSLLNIPFPCRKKQLLIIFTTGTYAKTKKERCIQAIPYSCVLFFLLS